MDNKTVYGYNENGQVTKVTTTGNITKIWRNGYLASEYVYTADNRLYSEENTIKYKEGNVKTKTVYGYDTNGNITSKKIERYEDGKKSFEDNVTYTYSGDKLIKYTNYLGEQACVYNNLGNPTTYRGLTLEWEYGVRLTGYGGTSYSYDGLGRRLNEGGYWFTYDSNGRIIARSDGLRFFYDHTGVAGFMYNNKTYYYRKDMQGNIIAILTTVGKVVAEYHYDAWGNHEVVEKDVTNPGVADKNPFRYRGYYYDSSTKLYYLQTRYYDPELGRFISQDNVNNINAYEQDGLNLYAYCLNNPVMRTDSQGTNWWSDIWKNIFNFIVNAASWTTTNIIKPAVEWGVNNWDIVLGASLIVAGTIVSIASLGAANAISGIVFGSVFGGILGGAFGALSAYSRGENVVMGMLNGLLVGIAGGFNPAAAGLVAAGMTFFVDRANGYMPSNISLKKAFTNSVIALIFAGGSNGFAGLIIDKSKEFIIKSVANFVSGFIFSAYSFVADALSKLFWVC